MSAPLPSPSATSSWRAYLLGLLLFIIVTAFSGMLFLRHTSLQPELRFPNGTVLTFQEITETSGPHGDHPAPRASRQSWWGRTYHKAWTASPEWAQRRLPQPSLPFIWINPTSFAKARIGAPTYRLWFESAGPKVELGKWLVSIEGRATQGHGYGDVAVLSMRTKSGISITSPSADRWFVIHTDTLPDKPTVHVTFKDRDELLTIDVPNPKYRPEAK